MFFNALRTKALQPLREKLQPQEYVIAQKLKCLYQRHLNLTRFHIHLMIIWYEVEMLCMKALERQRHLQGYMLIWTSHTRSNVYF